MRIDSANFSQLVDLALQAGRTPQLRPVVEKELLHYDILFCLDQAGLLDQLVFQGGTSLRLCYGGNRFSEDLDFAGGKDFSAVSLTKMKQCIEDYIGSRYGFEVSVKEPASLREDPKYADLKVNKWQIAVVTAPERKDIPKQKIKIDVANIPAYSKQPLPLIKNYDFLPDGYDDMLVLVETLDEILADKLVSLSATQKYIRYRDLWDLPWLLQQGAKLKLEFVEKKIQDYQLSEFDNLLKARIDSLQTIINDGKLKDEMRRFLPSDVYYRTLDTEKFNHYLTHTLTKLHEQVYDLLFGNKIDSQEEYKL